MTRELIGRRFIPISNQPLTTEDGKQYIQTRRIPVQESRETFKWQTGTITYFYLNYCSPPVDLLAGGLDIETAHKGLRQQMVSHIAIYSNGKFNPLPLNARLEKRLLRRYFRPQV